jgi:uncharacterized protein (DUF697 family)
MVKISHVVALVAGLGALSPMVANAAPLFTPHSQLVQEINSSYGTQFTVPAQSAYTATTAQGIHNKG